MGKRRAKRFDLTKDIFTSGEVARIFGVSRVTVNKWIDTKRLEGFALPDSRERRISLASLNRFIEENGIPRTNLFLSHDNLSGFHFRNSTRKPVDAPVTLEILDRERTFCRGRARLANLGLGGAFVEDVEIKGGVLPANGPVVLRLTIDEGILAGLSILAEILRFEAQKDVEGWGWGLVFRGLDEEALGKIRHFLSLL